VRGGAAVGWVVVFLQQPGHQHGPFARGREALPLGDALAAVHADQAIEQLAQPRHVREEMPVLVHQQRDADRGIGLQREAFACPHALDQRVRNLELADLFRFAFHEYFP